MKTAKNVLAVFVAASIYADGEVQAEELELLKEIVEGLEMPELEEEVKALLPKFEAWSEDELDAQLTEAAKGVAPEEREDMLDMCLSIICADGVVAVDEIAIYYAIADLLGIAEEKADEIFNAYIDEDEELIIEEEYEDEDEE